MPGLKVPRAAVRSRRSPARAALRLFHRAVYWQSAVAAGLAACCCFIAVVFLVVDMRVQSLAWPPSELVVPLGARVPVPLLVEPVTEPLALPPPVAPLDDVPEPLRDAPPPLSDCCAMAAVAMPIES